MRHKVALKAPAGIRGQIHSGHAGGSGKNYDISEEGHVVVDAVDSAPLIAQGYLVLPQDDERDPDAPPYQSDSPTAAVEGASATRPEDRQRNQRDVEIDDGQQSQDFGNATPPHSPAPDGVATDAPTADLQRAGADEEVAAAERAGIDPVPSQVPGTGDMGAVKVSQAEQDAARGVDREPETEGTPGGEPYVPGSYADR